MKILVIGAGLGGLSASLGLRLDGHDVEVVDAVQEFGEVGAGIRMPPNSIRLLQRWGVDFDKMKKSLGGQYRFYRWKDGSTITQVSFEDAPKIHGAPYYQIHRADLHRGLLEAAEAAGVKIKTSARVVDYDFEAPSVTLEDGRKLIGDLVVAADGIRSLCRQKLTGQYDVTRNTGDVAYRIQIAGKDLLANANLADLITKPGSSYWVGPGAHIVGYPIRDGDIYNIIICHTVNFEEPSDGGWTVTGDIRELQQRFADWEPRVRDLIDLVPKYLKWNLRDIPPLEQWVHNKGKVVLLGDSCHPMLPYLSQGAAQAFEDAAALHQCLKTFPSVTEALLNYQRVRFPRASIIQAKTKEHQYILHVDDGPEQVERDNRMKVDSAENPVFWGYSERRDWLFSHDAENLQLHS